VGRWLAPLVLVLLGLSGCGGAVVRENSASQTVGKTSTHIAARDSADSYLNDGDTDPTTDQDYDNRPGNEVDEDNDQSQEKVYSGNDLYHDQDDRPIVLYGHEGSLRQRQEINEVVKRYYMSAAMGDGATMCSLLVPTFANSLPEDYGRAPGPQYLRGAKTCQMVVRRLVAHLHIRSTYGFEVTGVRLDDRNQGYALLGSRTMPAGDIPIGLEAGVWRISSLLANPLP
jgi:hypothetical protein